jgi:hypothetical protein
MVILERSAILSRRVIMLLTSEQISNIRALIELGFSAKRSAYKLKIDHREMRNAIKTYNMTIKKIPFTPDKIPLIIETYNNGVSIRQLSEIYDVGRRLIKGWIKARGVLRSVSDSNRITFFNQHYFDQIDTDIKAYWLGFFYADAYNSNITWTVNLALASKDMGHIRKLADAIELPRENITHSITINKENDKQYEHHSLKMYSKHLCETLNKLGCPQAKSFIIKYPEWLEPQFDKSFIRGMFDGDGCLTMRKKTKEWKWSLVSTKECCEVIQKKLKDYTSLNVYFECISNTNNNTFDFELTGNEQIKILADWLWSDSTVLNRLDRKYQKYLDLCNQQNNRQWMKSSNRKTYLLSKKTKEEIGKDIISGVNVDDIAKKYDISTKTVWVIKAKMDSPENTKSVVIGA